MRRKIKLFITLLFLVGMIALGGKLSELVEDSFSDGSFLANEETGGKVTDQGKDSPLVVIDPGHGGEDPGKVGEGGTLEKDLNLQIGKRLRAYLEEEGVLVLMTREEDEADSSKLADLKKRVKFINEADPALTVSIHQNSYPDESVRGPQVFYYGDSAVGEQAAALLQEQLWTLDEDARREIKANKTFYLLKKTKNPIVIVECGFLSNAQEEQKLIQEEYQNQVAEAIGKGVLVWLSNLES